MNNTNISSLNGGGNSLNIIRIGGAYEQANIVLYSDLNGCISNLLVNNGYYHSLAWNADYPGSARDITQTNIGLLYYCLHKDNKDEISGHLARPTYYHEYFSQKNLFTTTYGVCSLRPIIEFRE